MIQCDKRPFFSVSKIKYACTDMFPLIVGITLLSLALTTSAQATVVAEDVVIQFAGFDAETGEQLGSTVDLLIPVNSDDLFSVENLSFGGMFWEISNLNISGDIDPFTNLSFTVLNNAAVTANFVFNVTVPIVAQGPQTLIGGSTGGSVTDSNFDGIATVATIGSGTPFFSGEIDGSTVLEIYADPSSFSAPFAGGTANILALNPGLPGPTLSSGPAASTIGITHNFSLTPGDSIAVTSFFIVVAVPEPSSALLLGVGLPALLIRRRRTA